MRYWTALAVAFAALTLLAFGFLVFRHGHAKAMAAGFGAFLLSMVLAGVLTWVVTASAAWGLPFEQMLRQVAFRAIEAFAVAAAMLLFGLALLKKRFDALALSLGALAFWALGLVALAVLLPSASFPVQWPLLLVSLAMVSKRRWALHLALGASMVLLAPLGYSLHVAAGNGTPAVTAVFGALAGALFLPLFADASRKALVFTGAGLVAAAALVIPVSRMAVGSGERADYLSHATDGDSGVSWWLADANAPKGSLAEQRVPGDATAELGDVDPWFNVRRSGPAPRFERPEPVVAISESPSPGMRRVELLLRSQARCVHLWQEAGGAVTTESVNGKPVPDLVRFSPELDARLMRLLTGDRSPALWKAKYCGPPGTDLRFVVQAPAGEKVPVRLVESFDGLPPGAGQRGAGLVPTMGGDVSLVARRLRL
ncbi:MAG: hypothetical protein QM765_31625 [Myxococcales bacterium]